MMRSPKTTLGAVLAGLVIGTLASVAAAAVFLGTLKLMDLISKAWT